MKYNNADMTPFDMAKAPVKQNPLLLPVVWGASFILTRQFGLKITKDLKGIKPPYLVIATHQGFSDYCIAPLALFPHRACYVSDMEGYANFGEWLYRNIGCIGKRRFVSEPAVLLNMKRAVKMKQTVVVYPESRHSNVGTTSYIPPMAGLAKYLKIPLCVLSVHGCYLANPFWDEERTRKTPMKARLELLYTAEQLQNTPDNVIQQEIEKSLKYDEYKWQYDNGIKIKEQFRAEGLHHPLYQCRFCGAPHRMNSSGAELFCENCEKRWLLDKNGRLQGENGEIHIPDWYEWERENAVNSVGEDYCEEFSVRIEALPNSKGFVMLGEGRLICEKSGYSLVYGNKKLYFSRRNMESLQTEFNYQGRGKCVVLSDRNCCYYLYSDDESFSPMRLQFIAEHLYQSALKSQ